MQRYIKLFIIFLAVIMLVSCTSYEANEQETTFQVTAVQPTAEPTPSPTAKRHIYYMDPNEDYVSILIANPGEVILSNSVREFADMNLGVDEYLEVDLMVNYEFEPFMKITEYKYNGRTVYEWKIDPLTKQHDQWVGEFKEKFSRTEEYIRRKEEGEWDEMYKEYLLSIANDENNLINIIEMYDTYMAAYADYEQAEKEYRIEIGRAINTAECQRLAECGLFVETVVTEYGYYIIRGELNGQDINNFPVSTEYGYSISLVGDPLEGMD